MADLPFATHKKDQPVKIRMGDGTAGIEAKTVVAAFDKIVQKFGSKPALHQKVIKAVSLVWLSLDEFRFSQSINQSINCQDGYSRV